MVQRFNVHAYLGATFVNQTCWQRVLVFEPGVACDLLQAVPHLWIRHEDVFHEGFDFFAQVGTELIPCVQNLLVQRLSILVFKRQVTAK